MTTDRRIYNPQAPAQWQPVKEWVELADGAWICVWELSVAESFAVAEAARRHPRDPRPGPNEQEAALWLLAHSCRRGDGTPDAPDTSRVWNDMEIGKIMALAPADFGRLLIAARGLVEPEEVKEKEDGEGDFPPPRSGRGTK